MQRTNNFVMVSFCMIILIAGIAKGKSLYTIVNTDSSKIWAYEIDANSLTYQTEYDSLYGSAVGLALAGDYLFLTFETGDDVEVVSAKTMTSVQLINAPGSSNLAGIVADNSKQKVYVVDRTGASVYVYNWNSRVPELTLDDEIELEGLQSGEGTWGLALDEENDRLYVTLKSNTVRCYDTNDWSHLSDNDITVTHDAVGIAIDVPNQIIYTGVIVDQALLSKYVISTDTETTVDVRYIDGGVSADHVLGLAVDQDTGLIYVTIGNTGGGGSRRVVVFDSDLTLQWSSGNIGHPAGIAVAEVGYKEPLLDIVKDDNDVNCVEPLISETEHEYFSADYNWLYYNIAWDANGYADSNVIVVDYLPNGVDEPNMISDGGVYDSNEHTVTWTLGEMAANDSNEFHIRVGVNHYAKPGGIIKNICEIEGDTYASFYAVTDTNVCCWGSEIIYVDEDANGFNNGTNWNDAYMDLRNAFTGAQNCGVLVTAIWVGAGTYKPTQNTGDSSISFELVEDVGVFGHFGGVGTYETSTSQRDFSDTNNTTILEGQIGQDTGEAVTNIVKAEDVEDGIIDGFTIQGSYGGAGVYIDDCNVAVVNCKIKDNDDYGIQAINYSYIDIHNCLFEGNSSQNINVVTHCNPIVSYCSFDGNDVTADGINISSYIALDVQNSVFKSHTDNGIEASGSNLTIDHSIIDGSTDNGLEVASSNLTIDHSIIDGSTDNGLYMNTGCNLTLNNSIIRYSGEHGINLSDNISTIIINSWIHNNGTDNSAIKGSGFYSSNHTENTLNLRNNTIYDNYTYGVECGEYGADPNIGNCIIAGNDSNDLYRVNGGFSRVNYCLLQNTRAGTGNITGDPCFVNIDVDSNDLHIDVNSICKDAGDPNGSYDELDFDGENRIYYGCVDIGADEYYLSLADFDDDGIVNFVDYSIFAAAWQSEPNDSDYNEDCDLVDNNSIDVSDLSVFSEDWLWQVAWPDKRMLLAMDFESGIPTSWTVVDGYSDSETWRTDNPRNRSSEYWTGDFCIVDSYDAGSVDMDEILRTPVIDCSGAIEVVLNFSHCFDYDYYGNEEKCDVDISINYGSWQNILRYTGEDAEGNVFKDISTYAANQSNVRIRWHYYDANREYYWGIDNVKVVGNYRISPMQMAMGGGGSLLKSGMMMESSLFSVSEFTIDSAVQESSDELMLSAVESRAKRPERLAAKSEKFYEITAATTITAMQDAYDAMGTNPVDIKEVLKWLDEMWADGELELTKKEYKEFREVIEASSDF